MQYENPETSCSIKRSYLVSALRSTLIGSELEAVESESFAWVNIAAAATAATVALVGNAT